MHVSSICRCITAACLQRGGTVMAVVTVDGQTLF